MEIRPMTFKGIASNPNLQDRVREKITKTRMPKDIRALLENKEYQAVLTNKDHMGMIWVKLKMEGGFYRNQTHIIEIKLNASNGTFNYPFTAPLVRFLTPMYHVNVLGGSICLSILKGKADDNGEGWTEACTLVGVIDAIKLLLDVPGIESPWNKEAAVVWMSSNEGKNEAMFIKEADRYYFANNYATFIEEFDLRYAEDNSPCKI